MKRRTGGPRSRPAPPLRSRLILLLVAALVIPGSIITYLTLRTIRQEELLMQQRIERRCQVAAEVVLGDVEDWLASLENSLADVAGATDLAGLEAGFLDLISFDPLAGVAFILRPGRPPEFPGFDEPASPPREPGSVLPRAELELFDELMLQGERLLADGEGGEAASLFDALAEGYDDQPELAGRARSAEARCLVAAGEVDRALTIYLAIAREPVVVRGPDLLPVSALAILRAAELYETRGEADRALDLLADQVVMLAWDTMRHEYGADWMEVIEARVNTLAGRCDQAAGDEARRRLEEAWGFYRFLRPFSTGIMRDLEGQATREVSKGGPVRLGTIVAGTPISVMALPAALEGGEHCLVGVGIEVEEIRAHLLSDSIEGELATSWGCMARLVEVGGGVVHPSVPSTPPEATPSSSAAAPPAEQAWYEHDLGPGLGFWRVQIFPLDVEELELGRRRALWMQVGVVFALIVLVAVVVTVTLRALNREVALARLKSEFVSSVSHELKTPLTAIRMLGEMLQAGDVPSDKRARYQETIVRESMRLTRLIDNILDFDRLERGRREFTFERVLVDEVVGEAVETARLEAASEGFSFEVRIEPDLPAVSADRDALVQVLLNLLSNAVKYSRDEKLIDVRVRRRGGRLVVEVEDHGVGIAPADQEKIFERFHRVATSERTARGAGLGLAIARLIADAHDGRLTVESTPGNGSTFTLSLPLTREIDDVEQDHSGGRRRTRHSAGAGRPSE